MGNYKFEWLIHYFLTQKVCYIPRNKLIKIFKSLLALRSNIYFVHIFPFKKKKLSFHHFMFIPLRFEESNSQT